MGQIENSLPAIYFTIQCYHNYLWFVWLCAVIWRQLRRDRHVDNGRSCCVSATSLCRVRSCHEPLPSAGLMLVQRRRRWTSIKPALGIVVIIVMKLTVISVRVDWSVLSLYNLISVIAVHALGITGGEPYQWLDRLTFVNWNHTFLFYARAFTDEDVAALL